MNCRTCQNQLEQLMPDLLHDPAAVVSPALKGHLEACAACAEELASIQATFALLDGWTAPEPSAFFDQKLAVRLREEQASAAPSLMERMRSYLLFSTGRQLRPALSGGLALVLLLGGGTLARHHGYPPAATTQASATVDDLQILDKNEQALQQMDLLQEEDKTDDTGSTQPLT